jgi:peptide/nickel transport system permease protein
MSRYIVRRLVFFLITLWFTSVLIFSLTWLLPGDACEIKLQRDATPDRLRECRRDLNLDAPVYMQYGQWALNFIQGDWGTSLFDNTDVNDEISLRLENSLRLALVVLVITTPLGVFFGVVAGLNENNPIDGVISIITLAFVSVPEFITSLFLINTVGEEWAKDWDWLPWELRTTATQFDNSMSLWESLPFITFPVIAASLVLLGYIVRLTRAGVIEELKRDYVRTAELKGMPYWQVLFKHVLRNALLPTVTVLAISMGWLLSGLVVIESIFKYEGLGRFLVASVKKRDLPFIVAITMVSVMIILVANFVADMLYAILNPRIRYSE